MENCWPKVRMGVVAGFGASKTTGPISPLNSLLAHCSSWVQRKHTGPYKTALAHTQR